MGLALTFRDQVDGVVVVRRGEGLGVRVVVLGDRAVDRLRVAGVQLVELIDESGRRRDTGLFGLPS